MSWARCDLGHVHWGPRGAAGLLVAEGGRLLLQLRATWAHQGGTWSVPGGARERGETGVEAALREAGEELGLAPDAVDVRGSSMADCGGWTYETVLAVPYGVLELRDRAESDGHEWFASADVSALPLHPAFRKAWDAAESPLREFVATS
ncbi:NUDIX hydrolase [Nocardioides sp. CN2-186]|uniref:NUDIX hydrolase n=1 Tax=Nocardioides tweenelious TaxID=3156607 RepID=UPI0032B3C5C9